jgi:predicted DNA-binding transcriptional regulator YafY
MKSYNASEIVDELSFQGFKTNERLVALDIQELRNLGAEIPGHRFVKYAYKRPFSLLQSLEGVEMANINEVLAYLRQITHASLPRDQMDKLLIYFEQMVRNPELEENPYIQYEKVELKNIEKLDKFYRFITENRIIEIDYTYFGRESVTKTIIPVVLKEYNNRWTLIAFDMDKKSYQNFPLDRIEKERLSSQSLSGESSFAAKEHFANVIGVSVPQTQAVEVIKFKVMKPRAYYVKTKPWHISQVLEEEQEEFMVFKINVIPNLELWAKIMEHIEDIEILEPISIREKFFEKIRNLSSRILTDV